jgi:hypothetical protein
VDVKARSARRYVTYPVIPIGISASSMIEKKKRCEIFLLIKDISDFWAEKYDFGWKVDQFKVMFDEK